ncbi:chaperone protein dnaJ 6, partial [Pseudovirgaria hyperparasitica]
DDEELLEDPPNSINPYEVLGIEKAATADQIKSAYRKSALIHHPDKAQPENKEAAHKKFQEIAFAYAILSDERRRKRYDITGRTEESLDLDDDGFNWMDFYKAEFEDVVTGDAIEKFKKEYKGSDEERQALFNAYEEYEGDLNQIYSVIMLSDPLEDEPRFKKWLDEAIKSGQLPDHPKYTKETAKSRKQRMNQAKSEGKEAMEYAKELGVADKLFGSGSKKPGGKGSEDALAALIQQRQKSRAGNFLADLEARYAPKPKGSKKRATPCTDEPPEEAFQRNATKSKESKAA